jgi:hypothetical protein
MAGPASLEGKKICFAAMYIIAENEKHTAFLQNEAFAESACSWEGWRGVLARR